MPSLKRTVGDTHEYAVSPVVGVMLMLVVVIIIAAVVSAFSGGIIKGDQQKVPRLTMDLKIANNGHWSTSYFKGEVTSTDKPVDTHDLKIITKWNKKFPNGTVLPGGATTTPGLLNVNLLYDTHGGDFDLWRLTAPLGYGTGVGQNSTLLKGNVFWNCDGSGTLYNVEQGDITNYTWWGNYKLQAGTLFLARPFGGSKISQATGGQGSRLVGYGANKRFAYNYSDTAYEERSSGYSLRATTMAGGTGYLKNEGANSGMFFYPYPKSPDRMPSVWIPYVESLPADWDPRTYSIDMMQGILGENWEVLRGGDVVNVKFIHIPTGKTVWEKDVVVDGTVY